MSQFVVLQLTAHCCNWRQFM